MNLNRTVDVKLSESLKCPSCGWIAGHNIACKYELEQEVKLLRADAERYRFLRVPDNAIVYAKDRNAWGEGASGHVRYHTPEQLDAAIDAALAATGGKDGSR